MRRHDLSPGGRQGAQARMRYIETIDRELRSVVAVRRTAQDHGGPVPLIEVVDALLDERLELTGS